MYNTWNKIYDWKDSFFLTKNDLHLSLSSLSFKLAITLPNDQCFNALLQLETFSSPIFKTTHIAGKRMREKIEIEIKQKALLGRSKYKPFSLDPTRVDKSY